MSTVVHYIKHWDNDTKGSVEIDKDNLVDAIEKARELLLVDAIEDGVKSAWLDADNYFTITKAEIVEGVQNYTGVPKATF